MKNSGVSPDSWARGVAVPDQKRGRSNNPAKGGFRQQQPVLQSTANSWAMNQKKDLVDERAKVKRTVQGMLNKLTFENFDKLYDELVEVPEISTLDDLK